MVPALGAAVGFAQDPDADRLAIVDENGRYIGEELTLALAASHRLAQAIGPVVLNLSTSRTTEDLAGRFGCPVIRTPVGEIHVVEAMRAHSAVLGGEGNGGVIDPRVGFVRDSFAAMALVLDLLAKTGQATLRAGGRPAEVRDGQGPVSDWETRRPRSKELFDRIAAAYPEAEGRPPRRAPARLARPMGARPVEQHRADRPRDRRGGRPGTARALADEVGRRVSAGRES